MDHAETDEDVLPGTDRAALDGAFSFCHAKGSNPARQEMAGKEWVRASMPDH